MSNFTSQDHQYMTRALQLAERGRFSTHPNPRVGCVLVKDGTVIGEGFHEQQGCAHAEVNALLQAGEQARGATAYVTLEPCSHQGHTSACAKALITAGVQKVVAAMVDPNPLVAGNGLALLRQAGIAVECGLMEQTAQMLNAGFIKRMSESRPFVRLKLACSLDGRSAMASGESQWITGEAARNDVQRLRGQADAVVTGVGSVLDDNPAMNARYVVPAPYMDVQRQPLRVILDSQLRTPVDSQILKLNGQVAIFHDPDYDNQQLDQLKNVDLLGVDPKQLEQVFSTLAEREINECHVECGAALAASLIEANLVDELVVYMAAKLMGSSARPLIDLPLDKMSQCIELELQECRAVGQDLRLTYTPKQTQSKE